MNFLNDLKINPDNPGSSTGSKWLTSNNNQKLTSFSPVTGDKIANILLSTQTDYQHIIKQSCEAFKFWQLLPAPKRGDIIRLICQNIRQKKASLAQLISYEMGKSLQEGLGEVQEVIDMGDFAIGLSRMLYGNTMHSERPKHRLYEQYHPLGPTGIITAFNFPVAVWAWNTFIAAVCGDVIIWKPSSKVILSAIAIQKIITHTLLNTNLPEGIFSLITGDGKDIGEAMINEHRIPLISFTGSIKTGRHISKTVAGRFGKTILELGGNNAIILSKNSDIALAIPAVVFGSVGTAGQRCTTTRRLIIDETIYNQIVEKLLNAYKSLKIGSPLDEQNHIGPLIDKAAVATYSQAIETIKKQGGEILYGGEILQGQGYESGCYVTPVLAQVSEDLPIVQEETFAPILYLIKYPNDDIKRAIDIQNQVKQGLSSAIFSNDIRETELFLSSSGSDCGIANVNIGTSGAEIGGAFGGEKETGGGREAGSDSWKAYMRRQTVTINHSRELPLAQGITFNL